VSVLLTGRSRPDPLRLSTLQVQLLASALLAAAAPDRDLLAPAAYVPSGVCGAWSTALFDALPDLVLVHVWDDARAQLPPLAERTAVMHDPLGPLLLSVAGWLATSGGCTLGPG
jgi:hypothetical protein